MMRITPAVRFTAGGGKIKPYMQGGLSLGMGGKMFYSESGTSAHATLGLGSYMMEQEMTGGLSLGFTAGLGATWSLSDAFALFSEITVYGQSWAPKEGIITLYEVNGQDQLAGATVSEREFEYVNSVSSTDNNSTGRPTKELKSYYQFGSVGLNIGVHFSF